MPQRPISPRCSGDYKKTVARESLALILFVFMAGCGQSTPVEDRQPKFVMVSVDDMANDSHELRNIIADPRFAVVLSDRVAELNRLLQGTS